jgi:hypothetical protein
MLMYTHGSDHKFYYVRRVLRDETCKRFHLGSFLTLCQEEEGDGRRLVVMSYDIIHYTEIHCSGFHIY